MVVEKEGTSQFRGGVFDLPQANNEARTT